MSDNLGSIRNRHDMVDLVEELGFLPFFNNAMPGYGYSVEELCVSEKWFGDGDGPWEWKGEVIREAGAAYGKFFRGKAGYVSADWFADFYNMRTEGLAFDERYELGMASMQCRVIMDLLEEHGPMLTRELRKAGHFGTKSDGGLPGFDGALTRLQMWGYVVTQGIEYDVDRNGNAYGWGLARMATSDMALPANLDEAPGGRTPDESRDRILDHLVGRLPHIPRASLVKLMENGTTAVRTGGTDRKGKVRAPIAWLVPANPKYFDLDAHLATSDELMWKQSTTILPGDEVYLYVTAPASEVRWHLRVLESDLPATGTYEIRIDRLMRLQLIERLDPPISRAELERYGVTHVRGPRHMPAMAELLA